MLLFTKDLAGAGQTMFSSTGCCRWRPPPLPLLDPMLKILPNHFIKPDFLSVYEETKSPASHQIAKTKKKVQLEFRTATVKSYYKSNLAYQVGCDFIWINFSIRKENKKVK